MKNYIGMGLAIVFGILIGFFGVFNSVFSDGALNERLIAIAVILLLYAILSGLWGFLLPRYSWQWGLFLGLPGVIFLALYMRSEFNPYYFLYLILILGVACLGGYGGHALTKGRP